MWTTYGSSRSARPCRRRRGPERYEIDKSDIDLPNDLLNVFERGELDVPELARMSVGPVDVRVDGGDQSYPIENGRVRCTEFPFVVLASNGERDFPAVFLRRCTGQECRTPPSRCWPTS